MCFGNLNEHRKYKIIVISYEITLHYFYFRSAANNSIAPVRTLQTQNGIRLVPASQLRQVQVILCQINTIFRQLTQNMTTDCSMNCSVRATYFVFISMPKSPDKFEAHLLLSENNTFLSLFLM